VVAATASGIAGAAVLAAALLLGGAGRVEAACTVVAQGPAKGQTWPERRREMAARNGVPAPGAGAVPGHRPGAPGRCGAALKSSAEVRYRVGLIAPVWRRYGALIAAAAARHGVPAELILAAIVEESGGRADAIVRYPGYVSDAATAQKISLGLGQMLLSTAQLLAPERRIGRAALLDPATAIDLVARYFARFYGATGFDPRLAGSSYNAGGVRLPRAGQRWSPPNARYVARFVAVFDAGVAHLAAQPDRPAVSFAAVFHQ
jgi:hypothetical protein